MDDNTLSELLVQILIAHDFAPRYYHFYEICLDQAKDRKPTAGLDELRDVLAEISPDFVIDHHEKFFAFFERNGAIETAVKLALPSNLELILDVKVGGAFAGGPFALLARMASEQIDPNFDYSPAYPKIPITDKDSLRRGVDFGLAFYQEIKEALFDHPALRSIR